MIETPRLTLRRHVLEDFGQLQTIWSDPRVTQFITGEPSTHTESWARLHRYAGHWALLGYGYFAAVEKETGDYFGDVGFGRFKRGLGDDFDEFDEAGWVLAPSAQGKGYAIEAMVALHDWHRTQCGPSRTVCVISPDHESSIRVAEKLGYRAYADRSFPPQNSKVVRLFERQPH